MSDQRPDRADETGPVAPSDPGHPTSSAGADEQDGGPSPVPAGEAPPKATIDKKRTIIGALVAIAFLVIVFARVIPQIGDYQGAADSLQNMDAASVATLALALVAYLLIYGIPFVAATPGLKYRHGFVVNQSAFAVGNGIPGGGAVGIAVQYAQLTFYGASPTAATAAVGATGIWSIFVTLGLPSLGLLAMLVTGQDVGAYVLAAGLGFLALIVIVVGFALILRSEKSARWLGSLGDRIGNSVLPKLRKGWQVDVTEQVLKLRGDVLDLVRSRWLAITAANFAVSLGQFTILVIALRSVAPGEELPYLAIFGAWAISQIGIMIPITPGGLGTVDALLISLLTTVGVSSATATAGALLWRATYYFPQILVGLITIGIWRVQAERQRSGKSG